MEERYERLERSRDPRDRRLDQWLETGRQLVDGVAGRRPGQRRAGLDLDSVGRWVGDKVEWLLEEDDDWRSLGRTVLSPRAVANDRFRPSLVGLVNVRCRLLRPRRRTTGLRTTCFRSSAGSGNLLSGLLQKWSRWISRLPQEGVCPARVVEEPDIAPLRRQA